MPERRTFKILEPAILARAGWALAGPLACILFVVMTLPKAMDKSHQRLRRGIRHARDTYESSLGRYRGAWYVSALKRVRESIPENEPYFILESTPSGADNYFVRFDLAPRPCIDMGRMNENPEVLRAKTQAPGAPKWVVIARLEEPGPEALLAKEFLERLPVK